MTVPHFGLYLEESHGGAIFDQTILNLGLLSNVIS